jgi:DnaK suppressor protein
MGAEAQGDLTGDSADAAFDAGTVELSSRLAEFEAREVKQISRALDKIKQGSYGSCEICTKKIPVARLNALPYTTCCVECQREMERDPSFGGDGAGSWTRIHEFESSSKQIDSVNLADLEIDIGR